MRMGMCYCRNHTVIVGDAAAEVDENTDTLEAEANVHIAQEVM
jgi:hypothetical protein